MKQLEERYTNLEEDHDGVKDVGIIQLLFKNTTCSYAGAVLEKLQFLWDLGKIIRWKNASNKHTSKFVHNAIQYRR